MFRRLFILSLLLTIYMIDGDYAVKATRPFPSEGNELPAKRVRTEVPIYAEFTGAEKNEAKEANINSPLLRLTPDLLGLVMNSNPRVQRTFYQGCRYLSMLVQDFNCPGKDGGCLIACIPVLLHDNNCFDGADRKYWAKRKFVGRMLTPTSSSYRLHESRFALRNIQLRPEISHRYLTPLAVAIFQRVLDENPHVCDIDYSRVTRIERNSFNPFHLMELCKSKQWPARSQPLTQLRRLCVSQYMNWCESIHGNVLYSFFPHPTELTNLEELTFRGNDLENILADRGTRPNYTSNCHHQWLTSLTKLQTLSFECLEQDGGIQISILFNGLTGLTRLSLTRAVSFNEQVYQSLSSLHNLQSLTFGNGSGFPSFRPLTFEPLSDLPLRQLKIGRDISGGYLLSTLPNLTTLTSLSLSDTYHGIDLACLSGLSRLTHLKVPSSVNFEEIERFSNLKCLKLITSPKYQNPDFVDIGRGFKQISSLMQLERIHFTSNGFDHLAETMLAPSEMIDPRVINELPHLTRIILTTKAKWIVLPFDPVFLKSSLKILSRETNILYKPASEYEALASAL